MFRLHSVIISPKLCILLNMFVSWLGPDQTDERGALTNREVWSDLDRLPSLTLHKYLAAIIFCGSFVKRLRSVLIQVSRGLRAVGVASYERSSSCKARDLCSFVPSTRKSANPRLSVIKIMICKRTEHEERRFLCWPKTQLMSSSQPLSALPWIVLLLRWKDFGHSSRVSLQDAPRRTSQQMALTAEVGFANFYETFLAEFQIN